MLSLVVIAVLVSATLIWRLYYVQLQDKGEYTSEIKKQIIRPVRIPPIRGRIESSDGKKLADNIPSFSLDFYLPEYRKPGVSKYWTAAENATAFIKQIENRIHQKSLVKTSQLEKILRRREKDLGLTTQKKAKTKEAYELQKRDNRRLRESNKEVIIVFDSLLPGLADQVKNLLLPDYFEWQDNSLLCLVHLINVDQGEGSFTRTAQALIQELDELCLLMNRKHQVNVDEVIRHLYRKPALPFRGLTDLTLEERTILAERKTKRYQVVMTPKRRYAHPYAFSHVTGYTGRRELSTHEDISDYFYFTPELWGRTGLEYVYDKDLAGNGGKELLYVNRSGYAVKQLKSIEDNQLQIKAEHGKNLKLTIDSEAQLIAYELMKEKRGSMVVMDIYTGGLVAMVSVPSFDLTRVRYRDYLKELNAKYPSLSDPQLPKPFYNRAVWEYMPGSIIKPLVAAIALEEGLIDENSVHDCTGAYHFGNKKIRCSNRWGHGEISVEKALEVSCNPFFIDLAVRLGMEKLVSFYEKAGLGKFPIYEEGSSKRLSYERKGILPDVEIDNKIGELTYIAIGQGKVELSPVQACSFIACIANGGAN